MVKHVRNGIKSQMSPGIKKRLGTQRLGSVKQNSDIGPRKSRVTDARQKILQTKRSNVRDARDVLANMAKKQDARSKLQKIRLKRSGNDNVRPIGANILKKTDRNGKISLVTNKPKVNDLNAAIQQQLGLLSVSVRSPKKIINKRPPPPVPKAPYVPPVIRKTILNDYTPAMPSYSNYEQPNYEQSDLYRWVHPDMLPQRNMKYAVPEMRYRPNPRLSGYVDLDAADDDEEMPMVSPVRHMKASIHSRLDSMPMSSQTHGIMSGNSKTKVVIPVGHRIVVSNLQGGVTEDDIRELFEDIGELLVARLVRPGTAEVIYKNLKDAQKAVETYHNRQLDGQPMKCLLVNKRPLNNPTAPAIHPESILASRKSSSSNSNKLVPDLSTIHKVLFQRD